MVLCSFQTKLFTDHMQEHYRPADPLYIVAVKTARGEQQLRQFVRDKKLNATVEGPRMRLYDDRSYSVFNVCWSHGWQDVVIWDCWHRRPVPIL